MTDCNQDARQQIEELSQKIIYATDPFTGLLPDGFELSESEQALFDKSGYLQDSVNSGPWTAKRALPPWHALRVSGDYSEKYLGMDDAFLALLAERRLALPKLYTEPGRKRDEAFTRWEGGVPDSDEDLERFLEEEQERMERCW